MLADDRLSIFLIIFGVFAVWYGLVLSARAIRSTRNLKQFIPKSLAMGFVGLAVVVFGVAAIVLAIVTPSL